MRRIISAAVAAIVALHAVLGCCWHHAHEAFAATVHTEMKISEPAKAHCCCCRSHHDELPSDVQPDGDRHQADDSAPAPAPCEGKCDTPAVNRVQQEDVATLSLIAWIATIEQPLFELAVFKSHPVRIDEDIQTLPIRLHLLHQLLLI